jgi:hypothetical protein
MADKKDTIYVDIDDEITTIIDKMSKSDSKIVAFVLPKRATTLQSIVNMKLLKRAADEAGKNPVLITSEKGLLPLAGATGMHVAKNLSSKPEIPPAPGKQDIDDEELTADLEPEKDADLNKAAAVGVLAGAAALTNDEDEAIDMQNEAAPAVASSAKKAKKTKNGKPAKIPNFEKFRKKIFIVGGALVAAIVLLFMAVVVWPTATIVIETNTESIDTTFAFTASPAATNVDESAGVVPAKLVTEKVNETATAPATGQKDFGTKATGTMTFTNCDKNDQTITVPAGTGVSSNGLTFITQSAATIPPSNFTGGGACKNDSSRTVNVAAQNNGDQYNLGARTYTNSVSGSLSSNGSQMSGGSSKIAKVVTQQDVDTAKAKISAKDDVSKKNLQQQLEKDGYFVIDESFKKSNEATTPTPGVDQEGSEVKVTYSADYTMLGVKRDDLKKMVSNSLKDDIDTDRQQVQDDGLEQATYTVKSVAANGDTVIEVATKAEVGPDIDTEALKNDIMGKKSGETENIVKALPGVKAVEVNYSPFWVSRTPKKASKITIEFKSNNQ